MAAYQREVMEEEAQNQKMDLDVERTVKDILGTIDREREREIIARRFGLFDRRETLEQIGELLGITRERVRQLEKAVVNRLKTAAEKDLPHINKVDEVLSAHLKDMGKVAKVSDISARLSKNNTRTDQAQVAFLANLSPNLAVIDDNDHFFHSIGLASEHTEKAIRNHVAKIIQAINEIGEPTDIKSISQKTGNPDPKHTEALAGISKNIATLNNRWGLIKWPMVNPKNIRDKIYVILHDNKKPMHFNEIAKAIKTSNLKRKDVTTQAIHNELIKDKRFVLIGRGIYALKEWGYEKGTVADVIAQVLSEAGEPLHRDEIVKRVLKSRFVKETTILLNL
ncbi:MAG TPA: sigma factor-like helix-turn-helix DNA-binding protein, partial [Candidatus Saccharimonadales bacterium]|nr:sigma factor-like helix-turn-helix DNA-binding protein [Candidatus Saccharimonadales bacterium]